MMNLNTLNGCQSCKIISPDSYGSCLADLGYAWTGNDCELVEGCGYGDDQAWFYDTYEICMTRCNYGGLNVNINNLPHRFNISSITPNPFNPTTSINYEVAQFSKISIEIFDIRL